MLKIAMLHHVSLPVSDLARARHFYGEVLGLKEDPGRPDFDFPGAWYQLGDRSIHLIVPAAGGRPTFRAGKAIDSRDTHCAIRVESFSGAIAHLEANGYRRTNDANPVPTADNPLPMRVNPAGKAGFPQIYILDPDRNVIEINAETLD
jgi:catechol 2,3-dioxygenase-like lactoylglutathione lyase family enzyme